MMYEASNAVVVAVTAAALFCMSVPYSAVVVVVSLGYVIYSSSMEDVNKGKTEYLCLAVASLGFATAYFMKGFLSLLGVCIGAYMVIRFLLSLFHAAEREEQEAILAQAYSEMQEAMDRIVASAKPVEFTGMTEEEHQNAIVAAVAEVEQRMREEARQSSERLQQSLRMQYEKKLDEASRQGAEQVAAAQKEFESRLAKVEADAERTVQENVARYRVKLESREKEIRTLQEKNDSMVEEHNEAMRKTKDDFGRIISKKDKALAEKDEQIAMLAKEIADLRASQGELVQRMEQDKQNAILRNKEIRNRIWQSISDAEFEVDIISPWMTRNVLDKEHIGLLQEAVRREVTVKILYGIGDPNDGDRRGAESKETANLLRKKLRKNLHIKRGNEHSKLILCDDKYYIITSFNPLSFKGDYNDRDLRGEIGELSHDKELLAMYRKEFFSF